MPSISLRVQYFLDIIFLLTMLCNHRRRLRRVSMMGIGVMFPQERDVEHRVDLHGQR
jgi:hypothetical protein